MTSSVSGKRSPAELIARDPSWRWRRESNPCARLCRPLPHHSATPPLGLMPLHLRADDGIRTRDPHLGKVMRYQLRYIRAPRTTRRPSRRTTIVHQSVAAQISTILAPGEVRTADTPRREIENPYAVSRSRHVTPDSALSHRRTPAVIDSPYGSTSSAPKAVSPAQKSELARRVRARSLAHSPARSPRAARVATSRGR